MDEATSGLDALPGAKVQAAPVKGGISVPGVNMLDSSATEQLLANMQDLINQRSKPDAFQNAAAATLREAEQIDDDFETLGGDALGQFTAGVAQVVHGAQVNGHFKALGLELVDEVEVLLARREVTLDGVQCGLGGDVAHLGVPNRTAVGTSGVHGLSGVTSAAPAPESRRRVISPVRTFSWRVKMACISVSGLGGQPGA